MAAVQPLTLTAPAVNAAVAGLQPAANASGRLVNANGGNSAGYLFSNGSSQAGDTIANAELLKGVPVNSRLYQFLTTAFASQADLDAAIVALGMQAHYTLPMLTAVPACSLLQFAPTVVTGVPKATLTTSAATGSFRISMPNTLGS